MRVNRYHKEMGGCLGNCMLMLPRDNNIRKGMVGWLRQQSSKLHVRQSMFFLHNWDVPDIELLCSSSLLACQVKMEKRRSTFNWISIIWPIWSTTLSTWRRGELCISISLSTKPFYGIREARGAFLACLIYVHGQQSKAKAFMVILLRAPFLLCMYLRSFIRFPSGWLPSRIKNDTITRNLNNCELKV